MRSNFLTFKIIAIAILIALFWIGLLFISTLVSERQGYQQAFLREISQNNISPQTVISPYIRVPYTEIKTCLDDKKVAYSCTEEQWIYISADSTQWTADFKVSDDAYKRTIYRAISYTANLTAKGIFQKPTLENKDYQWNRAEIMFPVHDPRGLDTQPTLKILNKNYTFEMSPKGSDASGFDFMRISTKNYPELINAIQNGFSFDLATNITGLGKFSLVPTSRSVSYQAKGNWADIKYSGQNLPFAKTSTHQQFTAQWKNIALGQQNISKLIECDTSDCIRQFSQGYYTQENAYDVEQSQRIGLSTEFLESVNVYTQTDRAIKYGVVIIIITFGCFFLFEVLKSLRIHPIQYSLVAIAQGNLVHLAGQLATDLTLDIKGQTQQTLDMIDRFLADAGTDKSHIMSVMIFLKDIENDYAAMNEVWDAWCSDIEALPRTCVEAKLYRPDVLVEMTVVAVKPESL
ncbi:hypothetical protein FQR65_LT15583 [Abscondita terminalis]|nr:hypothetical protein FQR65_LT15583 [Abscondita terminalis]